jgi:hypothetical protein
MPPYSDAIKDVVQQSFPIALQVILHQYAELKTKLYRA